MAMGAGFVLPEPDAGDMRAPEPIAVHGRQGAARFMAAALLCGSVGAATAHPHVFIVAKSGLLFDKDGKVAAIRQTWQFDEMYSSVVTEGLAADGKLVTKAQLAPIAKTNVEQLADFGWFTVARLGSKKLGFDPPVDYSLEQTPDKLVTLRFTLPLKTHEPAKPAFTFLVYDPTYFVAFEFDEKSPVTLVDAPKGCSLNMVKPGSLDASDKSKLSESYFTNMSPGQDFGLKLAARAIVACP